MIRAARLLQHVRPLRASAKSAAGTWTERTGLTLIVEDDAGLFGFGEAAPLPGFSPDDLESARGALVALLGTRFPEYGRCDIAAALADVVPPLPSAAARMALETALLDLWAHQASVPAWALLRPHDGSAMPELPLSLWLPGEPAAALAAAEEALDRGVRSFKVKLDGRDASDAGVSMLEALRAGLGPHVELRADANRSLTVAQAASLGPRLAELGVLWVEEPTPEPPGRDLGVPIALDESLVGARPSFLEFRAAGVRAIVLKPTVLGGLAPCLKLASAASEVGLGSVVSHTLEGPLGTMGAAALAFALGPGRPADGLAPHLGLSGFRPPCFHASADRLIAWSMPGLGLGLGQALAGTASVEEVRR
jgi:o-succinylbenzoate synthase